MVEHEVHDSDANASVHALKCVIENEELGLPEFASLLGNHEEEEKRNEVLVSLAESLLGQRPCAVVEADDNVKADGTRLGDKDV